MAENKKSVLIVGGGAVGAIAAVNLEVGGLATVTLVLRSNYNVVQENGYTIESCDHGSLKEWRLASVSLNLSQLPTCNSKQYISHVADMYISSSQHDPQFV